MARRRRSRPSPQVRVYSPSGDPARRSYSAGVPRSQSVRRSRLMGLAELHGSAGLTSSAPSDFPAFRRAFPPVSHQPGARRTAPGRSIRPQDPLRSAMRPTVSRALERLTQVCRKRKTRRKVLFREGVAGRSGGSPGPYKRTSTSNYRCAKWAGVALLGAGLASDTAPWWQLQK